MTCNYCYRFSRHPCYSREEASTCGNCPDQGSMLDFDSKQVAQWIRSNAYKSKDEDLVNELADLIEEDL